MLRPSLIYPRKNLFFQSLVRHIGKKPKKLAHIPRTPPDMSESITLSDFTREPVKTGRLMARYWKAHGFVKFVIDDPELLAKLKAGSARAKEIKSFQFPSEREANVGNITYNDVDKVMHEP